LRNEGFAIVATAVGPESVDLYELDLALPTGLVFGNEMRGVSSEAQAGADVLTTIPMMGMVESLNISVACAVTLYEALRQRRLGGAYDVPRIAPAVLDRLEREWLER
jgi:tRNA (guanosine-2'-O-)-methyltransferase